MVILQRFVLITGVATFQLMHKQPMLLLQLYQRHFQQKDLLDQLGLYNYQSYQCFLYKNQKQCRFDHKLMC